MEEALELDTMNGQFLVLGIGALGALFGYFLRYQLDRRKELVSKLTEEQRALYAAFAAIMTELPYAAMTGPDGPRRQAQLIADFREMYKKLPLHASPKVIRRLGDLMQHIYTSTASGVKVDPKEMLTLITATIAAMRSDLGMSNLGLGQRAWRLFRPQFNDMDKIMR